jgi:prepilin-type processing-associated H-X9-DG protein
MSGGKMNVKYLTSDGTVAPRCLGRTRRRGGTIINAITAVIFFGLLALGILWIIKTFGEAGQQYTTAMINTQDKATSLTCQMNLRSIGQNLQMYTISNESFPASQQELINISGGSRVFRCPDPNGGEYIYIPGQRADASPGNVLVYESKPVHNGRCNVLFVGGRIAALTPDELNQALEATLARRR